VLSGHCSLVDSLGGEHAELLPASLQSEQRLLWWGFCLLWLGGTWPYQAVLQAQAYYQASLPDLSFLVLMMFTWPLLGCHCAQVLSGLAKAAGFTRRIHLALGINTCVGLAFLVQDAIPMQPEGRRVAFMCLAACVAASQILLEPALFGLAAAISSPAASGGATQAMMVGNATAGVVVTLVSILTRLFSGGANPSPEQQRSSARAFFGVQIAYSLLSVLIFLNMMRRSPRLLAAAKPSGTQRTVQGGSDAPSIAVPLWYRMRGLKTALRATWRPAMCQFLCFGVTLTAWPSIPGSACVEGPFRALGQGWWFTIVVAVYNVLDLLGRLHLGRLQQLATRLGPRGCLLACACRMALPPLICLGVSPRLFAGGWDNAAILLAVGVLALSNGLLATASMMQVKEVAPRGLEEESVYVAVGGVYLGLACGATLSWVLARNVVKVGVLRCG
jgi:hypothetical protein